jgi:hypothetical protein
MNGIMNCNPFFLLGVLVKRHIMKRIFPFLFLIIFLSACGSEDLPGEKISEDPCSSENPTEDLAWLKEMINQSDTNSLYCSVYGVDRGVYEGKTVFLVYSSGALCCTFGTPVYNCSGVMLFTADNEKEKEITGKLVVYKRYKFLNC